MSPETRWECYADTAAVYVFMSASGRVLYVGQTGSLASRRPGSGHDNWAPAGGEAPAHLLVHMNGQDDAARRQEERDLIEWYQPPGNVQHVSDRRANRGLLDLPQLPSSTIDPAEMATEHGQLGPLRPSASVTTAKHGLPSIAGSKTAAKYGLLASTQPSASAAAKVAARYGLTSAFSSE